MADKQRISYVPFEDMTPEMQAEIERCAREGTPRPESSAIRAHVPAAFWFFAESWQNLFRDGVVDHDIKELCRVYISRSVKCEYCGNQRSEKGRALGLVEGQYDELMNFERSDRYGERQKAALAYAEAIEGGATGVAAGVFSTSRYVGSIVASGTLAALLGSPSVHSTGAGTAGGEGLPWYLAVLAIAASLSALAGLGIGTAPCAPR